MKYIIRNLNDYDDDNKIDIFYNKLYKDKKNKIDKYINNNTKRLSIIGDIILSELLIDNNLLYDKLDFYINKYGKPYIKNKDIYFNISHSHDYIITIISNKEIGIDIEKIRKTKLNTINFFATENEKKYILSSNNNIEERLFQIYTLKEAYFKMKGENLDNILNVEFIIDKDSIYCSDSNVNVGFINDINGYIIAYVENNYKN